MAAGFDPFKMMRTANSREEYGTVVEILCQALFMEDALELLPFLKGTLAEVIRREDDAIVKSKQKAKKSSAFGRYAGPEREAADARSDDQAPNRRWQRVLRSMFNAEAACALLDEVLIGYRGEEFTLAARNISDSWGPYDVYEDQLAAINALCLHLVLGPVLTRYGFSRSEQGSQDIASIIASLAASNAEVAARQSRVQKQVFGCFPKLGTGVTPTAAFGTAPESAGSRQPAKVGGDDDDDLPDLLEGNEGNEGLLNAKAGQSLSGGMWNRDAIARAAVASADDAIATTARNDGYLDGSRTSQARAAARARAAAELAPKSLREAFPGD